MRGIWASAILLLGCARSARVDVGVENLAAPAMQKLEVVAREVRARDASGEWHPLLDERFRKPVAAGEAATVGTASLPAGRYDALSVRYTTFAERTEGEIVSTDQTVDLPVRFCVEQGSRGAIVLLVRPPLPEARSASPSLDVTRVPECDLARLAGEPGIP